jgi:hypothetical protein
MGDGRDERLARPASWPIKRLVLYGLLFELLLVLSFVPAPLVPLTADSGMDQLVPWLELLGQPFHLRMERLAPWIGPERLAILLEMACMLLLFFPYVAALRALRDCSDVRVGRLILAFGALFSGTALLSRRLFSKDLFSYVLNGRIVVVHDGNPYLDVPALFPQDPFLALVDWREVPNFYGPLWTTIAAGVVAVGGDDLSVLLLLFRLVSALAVVGASIVIWRLLRQLRPHAAALGVALWAWNPLVVLESGGSGHNDAVLALLLVLALAGMVHRRVVIGLVALTAAVLVKYSAAILGPLYLAVLVRRARGGRGRRAVALGVAASGALTLALFAPYWGGGTLAVGALVSSPSRYLNSPAEIVFKQVKEWLGDERVLAVERNEFRPWWAATRQATELLLHRGEIPIGRIDAGHPLLATDRSDGRWQRVYNPSSGEFGYVALTDLRTAARPVGIGSDAELLTHGQTVPRNAAVGLLNVAIRGFGWLVVIVAMAMLLRSAASPNDLLHGWLVILTLVYGLVATWFFPWYLIWGLAIAAVRPRGSLVWALVAWSAGALTYYGLAPLEGDATLGVLYDWRAIPMFLPPLLVFGWGRLRAGRQRREGARVAYARLAAFCWPSPAR